MSVHLCTADGRDLKVNAWNWGTLHELVERAGWFDEDTWAPLRYNGGVELDAAATARLATEVLPRMRPGERALLDGSITDVPDDGTFYRGEDELWKNYSLDHDVLVAIIEFLRAAGGPVSVQ